MAAMAFGNCTCFVKSRQVSSREFGFKLGRNSAQLSLYSSFSLPSLQPITSRTAAQKQRPMGKQDFQNVPISFCFAVVTGGSLSSFHSYEMAAEAKRSQFKQKGRSMNSTGSGKSSTTVSRYFTRMMYCCHWHMQNLQWTSDWARSLNLIYFKIILAIQVNLFK